MKDGAETGGGGVLATTGHMGDRTSHHSYAMPVGTWCSSFQAIMKAIKKALEIIQTEVSPKESPNRLQQPIISAQYILPLTCNTH